MQQPNFSELLDKKWSFVFTYLDHDTAITSKSTEEHFEHISAVLTN